MTVFAVWRSDEETAVTLSKELRLLVDTAARIDGHAAPKQIQADLHVHQSPAAIIAEARERLSSVIDAEIVEPRELTR
jgi:hypothetical protein